MIRGQSGQTIGGQVNSATTGAAFVGTVTVYITIDAGAQTIGSVGSGICEAEGNGVYNYRPTAAETDGYFIQYTFIGTGAIPATVPVYTVTAAQQAALGGGSGAIAITARQLITEAFRDIRVLEAGGVLDDPEASDGLAKLTRLFDDWNAESSGVYASSFTTYTLTPDLQPHTIGPTAFSPTFTVTQRPVSIEWANIVMGSGTSRIRYRLAQWNSCWWGAIPMPGMTSSLPWGLYYAPDWPLGQLYLYPVPSAAYGLELQTRIVLAYLGLDDTVYLPPGYRSAVTLTLGEMLAPSYPPAVADTAGAAKARGRIFANNDVQPRLVTDAPSGRGGWSIINTLRGW